MKQLIRTSMLTMLGLIACRTNLPIGETSKAHANYKVVPTDVIHALPERMALLPVTKSMRAKEFFDALKLSRYQGNSTGSIRHSAIMLMLNESHVLEVQFDPLSFNAITRKQIDDVLTERRISKVVQYEFEVIGCTLWRNGNEAVAHRRLEVEKVE